MEMPCGVAPETPFPEVGEQGDTVGQHEGFGQIMRDHDDGPAEALP